MVKLKACWDGLSLGGNVASMGEGSACLALLGLSLLVTCVGSPEAKKYKRNGEWLPLSVILILNSTSALCSLMPGEGQR